MKGDLPQPTKDDRRPWSTQVLDTRLDIIFEQ